MLFGTYREIEHIMNINNAQRSEIGNEVHTLRWLIVDMNSFFASCEQEENKSLIGLPIIVVPVLADTTCAIAASREAKTCGIKTGTAVWQAKKLCPQLKIVEARPKLYVEYHHRILKAIESCIPIDAVLSIDEVACRLDVREQQEDIARHLAQKIKDALRKEVGICLTSSIGIASNKLLAKLASDMKKPDGLTVLNPSAMPEAILHLKLEDICGIGRNMAERLHHHGILTIEDLWKADTHQLRRVWGGVTGLRFHMMLHGSDFSAPPANPRRSISHQHVLSPNERQISKATPVIRQLLIRAATRLRSEGFYCCRLGLDIKWEQQLGHYAKEQSFSETQDTGFLLKVLNSLWEKAPPLRPLRIGITLAGLEMQENHQADLFERPKPAALMSAIDQLNEKFGRGTISYGSSVSSMISKIAFQRVPELKEF